MTDQNIIHSILQDTTDIISAQQSQVSEHYTTPPESSDDMHRQVSEEDELLPLRKKTRINVHLFPDNQSTNENMIELTSVNKNRSPPRKRKNLAQLNFKMQDQTSSAVDRVPACLCLCEYNQQTKNHISTVNPSKERANNEATNINRKCSEASVFIARERLCSVDYEKCTSQPVIIVTK